MTLVRMSPLVLLLAIAAPVGDAQEPSAVPNTARPAAAVNANPAVAGAQFGGTMASRGNGGGRNQLVSLSIPAIGDAPFSLTLLTTWKMPSNGPVRQVNDNSFYNSRRIVRDSAGRIYQERWSMVRDLPNLPDVTNMNEPKPQMISIQISDPSRMSHTTAAFKRRHAGRPTTGRNRPPAQGSRPTDRTRASRQARAWEQGPSRESKPKAIR